MGVKLGSHETGRSVARRAGPWRVRGALAGVARAAYTPSPMRHITIGLSSGLVAPAGARAPPAPPRRGVGGARRPRGLHSVAHAPYHDRLELGARRARARRRPGARARIGVGEASGLAPGRQPGAGPRAAPAAAPEPKGQPPNS